MTWRKYNSYYVSSNATYLHKIPEDLDVPTVPIWKINFKELLSERWLGTKQPNI